MRKITLFLLPLLVGMTICTFSYAQTTRKQFYDGKIIFQVKVGEAVPMPTDRNANVDLSAVPFLSRISQSYSITSVKQMHPQIDDANLRNAYEIIFKNYSGADELVNYLQNLGFVRYAEKEMIYYMYGNVTNPNDPSIGAQDYLTQIGASGAWAISNGSKSIVVADVDGAFLSKHEDLKNQITTSSFDVADNDANFDPPANNYSWKHGSNTAGLIAATTNNSLGLASIGFNLSLMLVKAAPDTTPDIPSANFNSVIYAVQHGARVINCSWGGGGLTTAQLSYVQSVIDYAYNNNVLVVAATGDNYGNYKNYPAGCNHVVSVTSVGPTDVISPQFATYGPYVTLAAPGENIACIMANGTNSGYGSLSGTSESAPLVSGLAGLMLASNPNLSPDQLKGCLTSTCDNIDASNSGLTGMYGAGRINATKAMGCAASTPAAKIDYPTTKALNTSKGNAVVFNLTSANTGSGSGSFVYTLVKKCPNDWTVSFDVNGNNYATSATVTVPGNTSMPVTIHVNPGVTPKVGMFSVKMTAPGSAVQSSTATVYVVSGVTDLVVSNFAYEGGNLGGTASNWVSRYTTGLATKTTTYDTTNQIIAYFLMNSSAMTGVKNIYYNVGWTFPSFSDTLVAEFSKFLTAGGNLFLSGQDIGWDTQSVEKGNSGYGTPATRAFFTNYLHAKWTADGYKTCATLKAITTDPVFKTAPAAAPILNYYGTDSTGAPRLFPDQMLPITGATAILKYGGNDSIAGIRYQGAYKVVYIGCGIEQVKNAADQTAIMKIIYDYFWGVSTGVEFDKAMQSLSQNFPNPSSGSTIIPFSELQENGTLQILDVTGRLVYSQEVVKGTKEVTVNTLNLDNGMYLYRLQSGTTVSAAKPMQVQH